MISRSPALLKPPCHRITTAHFSPSAKFLPSSTHFSVFPSSLLDPLLFLSHCLPLSLKQTSGSLRLTSFVPHLPETHMLLLRQTAEPNNNEQCFIVAQRLTVQAIKNKKDCVWRGWSVNEHATSKQRWTRPAFTSFYLLLEISRAFVGSCE